MKLNQELQQLNNRLDKSRRQLAIAEAARDAEKLSQLKKEIANLTQQITANKKKHVQELSTQAQKITAMPFHRAVTKQEQADIGQLKKKVKGLVIVHPMTALGKEMGCTEVTGFAFKPF
ncbi:YibL family ribosome-associated protein [Thaumasiovibrio sp. DFM-14]|uniref:YibL family ribosome-associated protein n=1 Tax=Thaumasiovibrio sp. DFM-14 TaxID=3384792 RepID=UPI00399EE949